MVYIAVLEYSYKGKLELRLSNCLSQVWQKIFLNTSIFLILLLVFGYYYRPQRSCGQGNIFTPVCHSVHGGGVVSHKALRQTPPQT